MENFFLQAVADSLSEPLLGTSPGRVWQPSPYLLVIDFRSRGGRPLFISVRPDEPAVFLARKAPVEEERTTEHDGFFPELVRKRLRGARVTSIRKPLADRVVTIELGLFDVSGQPDSASLVVELTGRSSNVYLLDSDARIVASIREIPPESYLTTKGRYQYPPPRPQRLPEGFSTDLVGHDESVDRLIQLLQNSPSLSRELEARAASSDLATAFRSLADDLGKRRDDARLYTCTKDGRSRFVLSTLPLKHLDACSDQIFDNVHDAAESRFLAVAAARRRESRTREVGSRIKSATDRVRRAIQVNERDRDAATGPEKARELAESLLAQLATVRIESGHVVFNDLYSDNQREVRLEIAEGQTPQQLADLLFKRHRKVRRAAELASERLEGLYDQRRRLSELEHRLGDAGSEAEIEDVDHDVDELLGLRRIAHCGRGRTGRSEQSSGGPRRFVSSDGFEILVGRSGASNDEVTFKIGRPGDLWLHVSDYAGSHVIVRNPNHVTLPQRTIVEAAQLAAYFSQARDESRVEVRYTQRKHVSKPKGASPGLVRLSRFRSVLVKPSAQIARAR